MKQALAFLCVMMLLTSVAGARTKEQNAQAAKLEEFRLKLKSEAFNDREEAVRSIGTLRKEDRSEFLNRELILLYKMEVERDAKRMEYADKPGMFEDKVPKEIQYTNTEEFHEYLGMLARLIAQTRDPAILPLLIRTMLETDVLIPYGDLAIDPVIREMESSGNEFRRLVAFVTLRQFYTYKGEAYAPNPEAKARIVAAAIKFAGHDKDGPNRSGAVEFLGDVGDRSVLPLLERIAADDPYHFRTEAVLGIDEEMPPGAKIIRYPVRNAARKAIERIKARDKER
ncbi:MAG: hypothetical protein ABFD52_08675 [Acidobacteriota bacterium]